MMTASWTDVEMMAFAQGGIIAVGASPMMTTTNTNTNTNANSYGVKAKQNSKLTPSMCSGPIPC
jgi:hypothetical protein